jgi:Smg protein
MFEILLYLYENYAAPEIRPDDDNLMRKLSVVGFEQGEIDTALNWLGDLDRMQAADFASGVNESRGFRVYAERESHVLDAECRGFLTALGEAGLLTPATREWIIDRAMALSDHDVNLPTLQRIALLVLWRQGHTDDMLFVEDLIYDDGPDYPAH